MVFHAVLLACDAGREVHAVQIIKTKEASAIELVLAV